ncbi:hypothetical protein [uncultured Mucilaginibacter sp.]|uniref:hypothetical protein n=1 Tax=uncultured Mucilaginibacter sp. TaxID=797541 RepID=UPI00262A27C4|nr:hypothetical protein [uncultured Mucilaginibacter sp.]
MTKENNQNEQPAIVDSTTTTAMTSGISLEDFKSFYYLINAKPDRETKFYSESKIVSKSNVIELNNLIQEKLNLSQIITNQVTIIISLDNNRTFDFGTWGQFIEERFHTSAVTKSITITWDFSIKLQNYKFPQRHTVKLRIGSKLKPRDMFELVMNHEEEEQLHEAFAHSICSIDFINPVISNEIFLIVENWHKALPKNFGNGKLQDFLQKNTKKIRQLLLLLVLTAGSIILFWLSKIYLNIIWTDTIDKVFLSRIFGGLLVSVLIFFIFYESGALWAHRTERYINRLKTSTLFKFTKGDENATEENKKKNNEILKSIGQKILITFIFNILAVFSNGLLNFFVNLFKR